jgi:hypothetical protein
MNAKAITGQSASGTPVLIYTHGAGRLGNQLLQFAHLLAWCLENKEKVWIINLSFCLYSNLLENFFDQPFPNYPMSRSHLLFLGYLFKMLPEWINRKIYSRLSVYSFKIGRFLPGCQSIGDEDMYQGQSIDLGDEELFETVSRKRATFLRGWQIRSWDLLAKHQNQVRDIMRFKESYVAEAEEFVQNARKEHDFLVGVFLRQSDYRSWEGGKYFFESLQYLEWIKQIEMLYKDKKIGFLIMSQELQSREFFASAHYLFGPGVPNGSGHYVLNLQALSRCDLILSPPSTFSAWASFLGKVPMLILEENGQIIRNEHIYKGGLFEAHKNKHFKISVR